MALFRRKIRKQPTDNCKDWLFWEYLGNLGFKVIRNTDTEITMLHRAELGDVVKHVIIKRDYQKHEEVGFKMIVKYNTKSGDKNGDVYQVTKYIKAARISTVPSEKDIKDALNSNYMYLPQALLERCKLMQEVEPTPAAVEA